MGSRGASTLKAGGAIATYPGPAREPSDYRNPVIVTTPGSGRTQVDELGDRAPVPVGRRHLEPPVEVGRQLRASHAVREAEIDLAPAHDEFVRPVRLPVQPRHCLLSRPPGHEPDVQLGGAG